MSGREGQIIRAGFALAVTAYRASVNQQREANVRAQAAMKDRSIMKSVNDNGARYVAVPVKKEVGQSGPAKVAKVRVSDGSVSSKLYDLPQGAQNGQPMGDSVLYLDKP